MTLHDHAEVFAAGIPPEPAELEGSWRMDSISTADEAGAIAWLHFQNQGNGTGAARYEMIGIAEGLATPKLLIDHFHVKDYAPLCQEIRKTADGRIVGKFETALTPDLESLFGATSVGLFHTGDAGRHTFCYVLERASKGRPRNTILSRFLKTPMPAGVGMDFEETMEGWYWPGQAEPEPGKEGDRSIGERVPPNADPPGTVSCSFRATVSTGDLQRFVDGPDHDAAMTGAITFGRFEGQSLATFPFEEGSRFQYQRLNAADGEAETIYHIVFSARGRKFALEGVKYIQKDSGANPQTIDEVLNDYTTVFCRIYELQAAGERKSVGIGYLKFRTFENLAAIGNLAGYMRSCRVTGASDPWVHFHACMRFLAFNAPYMRRDFQGTTD